MPSARQKWFTWFQLATDLRSSVIPSIWRRVVGTMVFAATVIASYYRVSVNKPILNTLIPTIVLGLLIVFRTNTAYDRYWEGRKCFGSLINQSQILSRNIWYVIPAKNERQQREKIEKIRLVYTLMIAIKAHLRKEYLNAELCSFLTNEQYAELEKAKHIPRIIINWLAGYFSHLYYQEGSVESCKKISSS